MNTTMMPAAGLCVFFMVLHQNYCQASEFNLDGDYLVGGLFPLHNLQQSFHHIRPVAFECDEGSFSLSGYQMFQVFRLAVEEINNSSTILPNVTLGYHLFDHCSDAHNVPAIFKFFSHNNSIKVRDLNHRHLPEVIGFTGPFSSTETMTMAPLFMMNFIPMVNYGAGSSLLSNKFVYPSFVRTVPSNRDEIELIIHIIKHFGWNWVAFIGSKTAYSENGFQLFIEHIENTDICLGYQHLMGNTSEVNKVLQNIERLSITVIILFTEQLFAEDIIKAARNFPKKVWIACDAWSRNAALPKLQDINKVGTIIGVAPTVVQPAGYNEFIYQSKHRGNSVHKDEGYCNQACDNCSSVSPEDIINENPTYSFPVYSAVYTMATALHNALQCNNSGCNKSRTVYPYMLLQEIKRLHFFLNQTSVSYDKNLDPPPHFSIVFWDTKHHAVKEIGVYHQPQDVFNFDDNQINWHGGSVPFSNCSVQCKSGYIQATHSLHRCCFDCVQCKRNKYANNTTNCMDCDKDEWSEPGSTSCQKRSVEYLHFSDVLSILTLLSAFSLILLCVGVAVLFAIHRSTPVVRSAGGSMSFLMLGFLAASAINVFFYFGKPSVLKCALQGRIFASFYTVCLSCLTVRSFQIICIFKLAAHMPKAHVWWVKYSGQWLLVAGVSLLQLLLCAISIARNWRDPEIDTQSKDQMLIKCNHADVTVSILCMAFMLIISGLCFCFSYMGTDLPKNYNEAKAITFSMLLFWISWAIFLTAMLVSQSKYVWMVRALVELSCLYGIIISFFIPKALIIVFQPMKNTQEYFQNAIHCYTQTLGRR